MALKRGPKKGYKQSPEHIAKRIKRGSEHPSWKGDNIGEKSGRTRALRLYGDGPCVVCGKPAERHHVDANTANNEPGNIRMLCRRHHMEEDGRLSAWADQARERIEATTASAAAARRARTECKRGHPLSGDNLYLMPSGGRACKKCRTIHTANYEARKKAKKQ